VCLTVIMGDLGAAHAGLDAQRLVMVLSPRLDITERVLAARRMLARAGRQQPAAFPLEAICLCGLMLDLNLPITAFPAQNHDPAQTVRKWLKGHRKPAASRELALADTGGFPAIRLELPAPLTGRPSSQATARRRRAGTGSDSRPGTRAALLFSAAATTAPPA
jgi:hypothetical protein